MYLFLELRKINGKPLSAFHKKNSIHTTEFLRQQQNKTRDSGLPNKITRGQTTKEERSVQTASHYPTRTILTAHLYR